MYRLREPCNSPLLLMLVYSLKGEEYEALRNPLCKHAGCPYLDKQWVSNCVYGGQSLDL